MFRVETLPSPEYCRRLGLLIVFFLPILVELVEGSSIEADREVLKELKSFLQRNNKIRHGHYIHWEEQILPFCNWPGITCTNGRVTHINLSGADISGPMFQNFSAFTELTHLDLSNNTICGQITPDLNLCKNLQYLNLSRNILQGTLNLTGLDQLETLDITRNRLQGTIQENFPSLCNRLITLNISINNFNGDITYMFDTCPNLQQLDISSNNFTGSLETTLARLTHFIALENQLSGQIPLNFFTDCSLEVLDVSVNRLTGTLPKQISNCNKLVSLNLFGNGFYGVIPNEIGALSTLKSLYLGENNFSPRIPESLLNCSKLALLDFSNHYFGGHVQPVLGRFKQLKYLVLHRNSYTGGMMPILQLTQLERLDLSFNNFSGRLPGKISNLAELKFLMLAYNQFSGEIPVEYGNLGNLQALDLSFNQLTGRIPPTIGNLRSLLWLMLAGNKLSGEIPAEIGKCSSLLWVNLAGNKLSGEIPAEIGHIGHDPEPTFAVNRNRDISLVATGECLAMMRWIPAPYPPFSFIYTSLTRKICRSIWNRILTGQGIIPLCLKSPVRSLGISGYLQLAGNNFSGELPGAIAEMRKLSLLDIAHNAFSGPLTPRLSKLPLVFLNFSSNRFSGEIPQEMGKIKCLHTLDLSCNNFSGAFPARLTSLSELTEFNVSYNPLLSGDVPEFGQLGTFDNNSFLGNPLLLRSGAGDNGTGRDLPAARCRNKLSFRVTTYVVILAFSFGLVCCLAASFGFCLLARGGSDSAGWDLTESGSVYHVTEPGFTYSDIVCATSNFSNEAVIGAGGFGTVYKGTLPGGRVVAIKKLRREGPEAEREFRSEMEILSPGDAGWPGRNLVGLLGWCLHGSEKLLVYEFFEGGSLDEVISDRTRLDSQRRVSVALDVARALVYLHHECPSPVVHRDVKASNVLLDRAGNAYVTDFGLARMVGPGESHVSTMVAGSIGYVAPEYAHTWHATTKGDVYSFGVLVLELATGRRAADGTEEGLVDWARRISHSMHGHDLASWNERSQIRYLFQIGLICTVDSPQARPGMEGVLHMLGQLLK